MDLPEPEEPTNAVSWLASNVSVRFRRTEKSARSGYAKLSSFLTIGRGLSTNLNAGVDLSEGVKAVSLSCCGKLARSRTCVAGCGRQQSAA